MLGITGNPNREKPRISAVVGYRANAQFPEWSGDGNMPAIETVRWCVGNTSISRRPSVRLFKPPVARAAPSGRSQPPEYVIR